MGDVLLVDSSSSTIEIITPILEGSGYEVTPATYGAAALQILGGIRYEAVVTELDLPGMSGLELIRKIRMRDNSIPVVVFSSVDDLDMVVEAMREGADDFVRKSAEDPETTLVLVIERSIRRRKRERHLRVFDAVLPICAYCKNIRYLPDNRSYAWVSIEEYFEKKKAGIEFSHGVCPECLKKYCTEDEP